MELAERIKNRALEAGFDLVGITDASAISGEEAGILLKWVKMGHCAGMDYLRQNLEKRINPALLLENAHSVIVVGLNYKPAEVIPPPLKTDAAVGRAACYACYEDYHVFIKKLLGELADFMAGICGEEAKFKICVDSVPLAERSLAARAGLGFIGRNHLLINPLLGPQILLGEIITTLELKPDEPVGGNYCGNCDKCLKACPTGALSRDSGFDANKCISYLTIEHKDKIPEELAKKIGERIFGCDQCVLACPFYEAAPPRSNTQFKFHSSRANLDLSGIFELDEKAFNAKFADTVIHRTGLEKLKRNARICLKNG